VRSSSASHIDSSARSKHLSPEQAWAPGPLSPRLDADTVHVWRADLAQDHDGVCELLSDDERARSARLAQPRDSAQWARSRGILRALLALYLGRDGAALSFTVSPHGKPALAPDPSAGEAGRELSFNLSHCGAVALYAFSSPMAVGVDVELERDATNVVALAQRLFGSDEARRLEGLDHDSRQREFFKSWVRHEAELKCLGVGIGGAPPSLERSQRPWLAELDTGVEELAAAVAVESGPRQLCCWSWPAA